MNGRMVGLPGIALIAVMTVAALGAGRPASAGSSLGDVNCDGVVDAIDAALILQYDVRLLPSLACSFEGDVNRDGVANALDAMLILQYDARLIGSLGPPRASPPEPAELTASPFIGGTATAPQPGGQPGIVDVIAIGEYSGSSLPIVVRNNRATSVIRVGASAIARGSSGQLLASCEDQGFHPYVVRPGEIAFGYVYCGFDVDLPDDVGWEITPSSTAGDEGHIWDLEITEVNMVEDRIVGLARNGHDHRVEGPIDALALCFDAAGHPVSTHMTFADQSSVEPGATASFQIDFYGNAGACHSFIVGSNGYDF